ncbi:hypothetical protein [Kineococcus sp. SYSU DK003]|uniref:hypothetical protein n=1 Tax=Kineococcus sp. SYSU DK003 TaxID=3383124 RepID=UPI003D7F0CBD
MPSLLRRIALAAATLAVTVQGTVLAPGLAQAAPGGCAPKGAIAGKYTSIGAVTSRLGSCVTDELPVARDGRAEFFQGGSIYWSRATGAHVLVGGIQAAYAGRGWENSVLGFPTTDEFGPLMRGGYGQHFQNGSLYWTPATGGVVVRGAFHRHWASSGWENSALGYPLRDEVALRDGAVQPFERGALYWSPATGAHAVLGAIFAAYAQRGYEWGDLGYPVTDEYDVPGGRRSDFQFGTITWNAATGATNVTVTGSRAPKVTVLGDSLTFGACGETAQRVGANSGVQGVACFGWPGATSDEMQAYVENPGFRSSWPNMLLPMPGVDLRAAVRSSDVLVVGLGTNDALRDRAGYDVRSWPQGDVAPLPSGHVPVDNGYFDQKIDYFMQLAAGKPVYWYDLGYHGGDRATAYYFSHRNDRLQQATRRWPNLRILPWAAAVRGNPRMMIDEVHVGEAGNSVRWNLLRTALGR